MEEKDLEQRLQFIESMTFSHPEIYELRRRLTELEGKFEVAVNNQLVEKIKDLENKVDILTRILADLKIDFDMQSYSIKNKKDTE